MLRTGQYLGQKQSLQQRLSPQQIQYIKLLQLPTTSLEMRIKEEIEQNPLLEDLSEIGTSHLSENDPAESANAENTSSDTDPVDANSDIDWDTIMHNPDFEGKQYNRKGTDSDWIDLPKPYMRNLFEVLEEQVALLNHTTGEQLIAEEIIGSLDEDGYLKRDLQAIIDSIVFNTGEMVNLKEAEHVLHQIQRLDPPGIASRDLRKCLMIQLELKPASTERDNALRMLDEEWDSFSKKHFEKIMRKLDLSEEDIKKAYECIQHLDPKPGKYDTGDQSSGYIIPDFHVTYEPEVASDGKSDPFKIVLNRRNSPPLRVSPSYKHMWDDLQQKSVTTRGDQETKDFIKQRMDSAKAFMDAIQQRSNTLMNVMRTIVNLQEKFFRTGSTLRPMILKDVAEIIKMDISTISRVVNGKYVQTKFGVYELKYFFTEGIETDDGENASNRDVKIQIQALVSEEKSKKPLTDDQLVHLLKEKGYVVARRTVSKYREQLGIPVARLRKSF